MPAAPNIASRTVTGTYHTPDGSGLPAVGTLRFIPSNTVQDITGHVMITQFPLEVELDEDGAFSIELMVTDDPDAQPQDWTWHLSELFPGGREVDFFLASTTPSTVDIATILPASDVVPFYDYASLSDVTAALATVAAVVEELNDRMNVVVPVAVRIHPFLQWVQD
jgi:hypothetical protein